jgi:hypothetical protein
LWFVDLTPTRDPGLVNQAIAAGLDIGDDTDEDLGHTLRRVVGGHNLARA